jgi:leader peptidase (prepilin peptidase)/N-methyltransferase
VGAELALMLEQDFILSIVTVVFSLLIGSFLNVVIVRLPRQIHWQWEKDGQGAAPPPGIAWPPSHCPSCEHALSWWENLPLLSYLLLRGRCRACGTGISLRYPLVEALTALLSLVVVVTMGPQWLTIAALMLTWALIALAFIDLEHFLLPDRITLPLLAAGLLVNAIGGFTDPLSAVIGAVSGYGLLWAVYHAYRALTGREGFGSWRLPGLATVAADYSVKCRRGRYHWDRIDPAASPSTQRTLAFWAFPGGSRLAGAVVGAKMEYDLSQHRWALA